MDVWQQNQHLHTIATHPQIFSPEYQASVVWW
jgi:hypothetical protein